MKDYILSIAKSKWFVPIVIFIMIVIALSSIVTSSDTPDTPVTTEQQLEELCNAIEGVSNAKVIITYDAVNVSTFLSSEKSNKILGIAVLCRGGDDPTVQLKLHQILQALFDLPSTRIAVSARN